ncbi:alpha/beta fold hydrolase [Mangrovibacillus cuniculi]|uniref:Alpha/beta hydrolase n=1 Tax=Mangrovibacillus cuniculi TaxID=2593652 RepID=A0A7S8CC92_9BACI|nr:alpha/beta hydrolase [Mangrovibacillus cuniculi]QPC47335.1 alpha/beta hydrolase [Mangrovibacillus cuniculi]
MNHIEIKGISVYYEDYRPEEYEDTVVLLHGFLSSTFSFRRLIPYFQNHYRVIAIDLPPFGKSAKNLSFPYSYKNLGDIVVELLQQLNIQEAHFMGHSMGGQIALNVMNNHSGIAKKGVLLCSSGYLKPAHLLLKGVSRLPYFHHYIKVWLTRSGILRNIENVVHNTAIISDEMILGYVRPFLEEDIFKALSQMIRHREGDLPSTTLQSIQTPILLLWGEQDKVVPLSVGERLVKDLPNANLHVLKNTGHLIPEERPEETFTYVHSYLSSETVVKQEKNIIPFTPTFDTI